MANIDEELDRLTERLEVLTQAVELLARQSMQADSGSILQMIQNHKRRFEYLEGKRRPGFKGGTLHVFAVQNIRYRTL